MLTTRLHEYIQNYNSAEANFNLGNEYELIGQTGAAISFYLRTAERSQTDLEQYTALLRMALCFERQQTRDDTEKVILQKAISLIPKRPEAYFLLSRLHEFKKEWQDSYTIASVGFEFCNVEQKPIENVEYPGNFGLLFQKGVAAWWVGHSEEAREIMADLKINYSLNQQFTQLVENNLNSIGYPSKKLSVKKTVKLDQFDWGNNSQEHIDIIKKEVFVDREYELYNQVKKNNIVVDIGANAGAFTYSILDRQPKQVYCLEPSSGLVTALKKNTQGHPVTVIDRAIGATVSDTADTKNFYIYGNTTDTIKTTTFQQFIQDHNIEQIDFLKFDCEGGEFDIFTKDNYDFIMTNIRYGVGEWHLSGFDNSVERFIQFRDLYLKNSSQFRVFERSGKEVTNSIFDDSAVQAFFDWWNPDMTAQYIVHFWNDPVHTALANSSMPSPVNHNSMPGFWVVDNFYLDPDAVRAFALKQDYDQGGLGKGYIGRRTRDQFLFPGLKEQFEQIMGQTITLWEDHGMNGRFQYNSEGEPLVYHCDAQRWAAMIYLTPDAPYETGTGTHALKGTDIRHRDHPEIMRCFRPGSQNLDGTLFEPVDVLGNVYNRLVIFNAGYLHSACGYFGWNQENSRLWQMFFFD